MSNIIIWVDWREEDERIIDYCENIIHTGCLSAKTIDAENERGFDIIITYKEEQTFIPYKGSKADRDTTIRTLNNVIQPEYEIRLCKDSFGNDTLAFLPLSKKEWEGLDTRFPVQSKKKFMKITTKTIIFG